MLRSPLGRCLGIGALLVGFVGLCALGGAGWSLDAALVGESNTIDEIGAFQAVTLDPGAEYRDGGTVAVGSSPGTDAAETASIVGESIPANALFAPEDRSESIHVGGLRFIYLVSLLGALLVAGRALVDWRFDPAAVALEPRETVPFGAGSESDGRAAPVRERRSRSRE